MPNARTTSTVFMSSCLLCLRDDVALAILPPSQAFSFSSHPPSSDPLASILMSSCCLCMHPFFPPSPLAPSCMHDDDQSLLDPLIKCLPSLTLTHARHTSYKGVNKDNLDRCVTGSSTVTKTIREVDLYIFSDFLCLHLNSPHETLTLITLTTSHLASKLLLTVDTVAVWER